MNTKFKMNEKTVTTLLYVGAAILVVAILCVSIFAFANQSRKNKNPVTTTQGEVTTQNKPPVTTTRAPVTTTAPTTTKVIGTISTPTDTKVTYKKPVEGTLAKNHDTETLVYSVTMNDYRVHTGIDIAADVGSPVYAIAAGKVTRVYSDYLMGTSIEIDHGNGLVSCYKNLSETIPDGISEGVTVSAGQLIAGVGETAIIEQSDESHLHFEVLKNGEYLNPLDILNYSTSTETVDKS